MDLSRVIARDSLAPQREPYWSRLAVGQYLGYRPAAVGKGGKWIARHYDPESRRNRFHAFGDFGYLPPNERYGAASKAAREWLEHVGGGGSHATRTVRQACEHYAKTRPDAETRFRRYVYGDPIAKVPLHKLTPQQVKAWRGRLEALPALVTRNKKGEPVTRARTASTLNRDMTPFRAALNLALEEGHALTSRAWKSALKPVEGADGRRNIYLDRDQRRALLEALPDDVAAFARALCLLPLRPGALAGALVRDFDWRRSELFVRDDKAGEGRKILLPQNAVSLLKAQTLRKLPNALLFARADGVRWSKDSWKGPIKDAVHAAGLPPDASLYALRHSVITDLVTGGLDLLTVAQVSGTSVRMIEAHYGHLRQQHAAEALARLTL